MAVDGFRLIWLPRWFLPVPRFDSQTAFFQYRNRIRLLRVSWIAEPWIKFQVAIRVGGRPAGLSGNGCYRDTAVKTFLKRRKTGSTLAHNLLLA